MGIRPERSQATRRAEVVHLILEIQGVRRGEYVDIHVTHGVGRDLIPIHFDAGCETTAGLYLDKLRQDGDCHLIVLDTTEVETSWCPNWSHRGPDRADAR